MPPQLFTIPSSDEAFRTFVQRAHDRTDPESPGAFERRLRQTYPRALVRERGLAGEVPSWYVYRDGAWRAADSEAWWEDAAAPQVEVDADGWIVQANATARGLLGADSLDSEPRHFTDFALPGATEDAVMLFDIVRTSGMFDATIVLQPASGDAIAVDLRVTQRGERMVAAFRLADGIDVPATETRPRPERVDYFPRTDVAFRAYAERAIARMPDPTPDGLALRLRRLYPHARVEDGAEGWVACCGRQADGRQSSPWWDEPGLPCVRYDGMALILDANDAAVAFFGRSLAGHHWQEFVTAGSTGEVEIMLAILAEAGAAESRFRMPRGDGSLVEFDSYTVAEGEEFSTVFRPVPLAEDTEPARAPSGEIRAPQPATAGAASPGL
jgi:PAS domain-containing protein